MSNLKIFGSQIHDTALVFILTSIPSSIIFNYFGEIKRDESILILIISTMISFLYWVKEYRNKKGGN
jgi:uncharacterized membrane protein YdjX (TVP38/TMEM64 family)